MRSIVGAATLGQWKEDGGRHQGQEIIHNKGVVDFTICLQRGVAIDCYVLSNFLPRFYRAPDGHFL